MLSAKRTAFTLKAASLFFISTLLINIFTPSSFVFAAELSDVERLEVMKSLKNSSDKIRVKVAENYGNIPLSFEKNEGQHNEKVKFSSRGKGYEIFLAPTESILRLSKSIPKEKKDSDKPENLDPLKNLPDIETSTVRMKVVGANPNSEVSGVDKQITKTNYFSGRDKSKWRTNIANYGKVNFDEVYPGIDMVYYGKQKQLEYDFVVKPGVDYKQIKLEFEGADNISLDEKGNLILETKAGNITQHAPIVYQEIDGKKVDVEGRYVVQDENKVSFQVVEYDQEKTLIIDPVVEYVVEFGGNHNQWIRDIAVDSSGNMFVVGATMMGRWGGEQMVVGNYVQSQHQMLGNDDCCGWGGFIMKISSSGDRVVFSSYFGGRGQSWIEAVAIGPAGNIYFTGSSASPDLPVTKGNLWVCGYTGTYNKRPYSRYSDIYITKMYADGHDLFWSGCMGGTSTEWANDIAVDSSGAAYVTGYTYSTQATPKTYEKRFPHVEMENAHCVTRSGGCGPLGYMAAFVVKLRPGGPFKGIAYATMFGGGNAEEGKAIAVDRNGYAWVTGWTQSGNFPMHPAGYQTLHGCGTTGSCRDAFVTRLNQSGGGIDFTTFFGGTDGSDIGTGIALGPAGDSVYITGTQGSPFFPWTDGTVDNTHFVPCSPASYYGRPFIAKFNFNVTQLHYSTCLKGVSSISKNIAFDSSGRVYITGAAGRGFPITNDAFQTRNAIDQYREYRSDYVAVLKELGGPKLSIDFGSYVGYGHGVGCCSRQTSHGVFIDTVGNIYLGGEGRADMEYFLGLGKEGAIYGDNISPWTNGRGFWAVKFNLASPDTTPPSITAPNDLIVEATGVNTSINFGQATATDDVSSPGNISITHNAPSSFPLGVTTITWTATDEAGNSSTATQKITVVDTIPPVITAPAGITVNTDAGLATAVVSFATPTATDSSGTPTIKQIAGLASGSAYPLGTTTNTFRATDAAGNTADHTFTVTVVDNENPVITGPANITVNTDAGLATAVVNFLAATATDNDSVASITQIAGPASGSAFPLGVTTVTFRAADPSGNTADGSFTVTVTDAEPPSITAPADMNVNTDAGLPTALVVFANATATDNSGSVTVNQIAGPASGSAFPIGSTTVTWEATDPSGNTAQASMTVTVADNEDPVITVSADISVNTDAGLPSAVVNFAASTAMDNDSVSSVTQIAGPASGSAFPLGVTTVTFRATDASGNTADGSFTVTVADNEDPVVTAPSNVSVEATDPQTSVAIGTATATDNVGVVAITSDAPATFPVGSTTVTWSATDAAGNTGTATQTVTITDTTAPVVTAPAAVTLEATGPTTPVTLGAASASDLVDGTLTPTPDNTGPFSVGTHTVTWSATDAAGNTGTATQTVTITDTTPPDITAPADVTEDATGSLTQVTLGTPTVSDLVSANANITMVNDAPSQGFPVDSTTTVTWTATDENGNSATATQEVTIKPFELTVSANKTKLKIHRGGDKDKDKDRDRGPRDWLQVAGTLTEFSNGDGLNYLSDPVTITLNGFNWTLPAGSFKLKRGDGDKDKDGDRGLTYRYKGGRTGLTEVSVDERGRFKLKVKRMDLSGLSFGTPIPFNVTIGNDSGETDVRFNIRRGKDDDKDKDDDKGKKKRGKRR